MNGLRRWLSLFRPPRTTRLALLVTQRNLRVWGKFFWSSVVANFVDPLIYLIGMGFGLGALVGRAAFSGYSYTEFIAPGLVAATVMNAASFECTFGSFTRMTTQRTYAAIIMTPVSIEEVVLGDILYGACKGVFCALAVLLVALAFGIVRPVGVLPAFFVAVLGGLVFAALAMVINAVSPSYDFFSYYITLAMTPMFFFSGIFFPLERPWMKAVAWCLPLTHLVDLCRGFCLRGFPVHWQDAVWLLVFLAVVYPPAVNLVARRLIR